MKKFMYSVILVLALLTPQKTRSWDGTLAGSKDWGDIAGVLIATGVVGGVVLTIVGYKICCALYKQMTAVPENQEV